MAKDEANADRQDIKRHLRSFVLLQSLLLPPNAIALVLLPRLWLRFRDKVYFPVLGGFEKSSNHKVNEFLQLALPHGIFNLKGVASLSGAILTGITINCIFLGIAWLCQREAAANKRSIRHSFAFSTEMVWLVFWITLTVFGGSVEWAVPSMPIGPFLSMLISLLNTQTVIHGDWSKADLAPAVHHGYLLATDDFASVKGSMALHVIQHAGDLTMREWMQIMAKNFVRAMTGGAAVQTMLVVLSSLVLLNFVVGVLRFGSFLLLLRRDFLGKERPQLVWWIAGWPLIGLAVAFGLATPYLMNYPKCTMNDHLPGANSSHEPPPNEPAAPHVVFSKAFDFSQTRGEPFFVHVDVYLPVRILEKWILENQIADFTVFTATRYNRATAVMWPFTVIPIWGQKRATGRAAILSWPLTKGLLNHGVPSVIADTRGSGGSSGVRYVDLDKDEITEMNDVARWTKHAFWTKPFLAAGGVSYDGMTALKMATEDDSPINLTIGLYSPLAPVTDLLQIDGIPCTSFLEDYDSITSTFEKRGSPALHLVKAALKGLTPFHVALGFSNVFNRALPAAGFELDLRDRMKSWSMKEQASSKMFISDKIRLSDGRVTPITNAGLIRSDFEKLALKGVAGYYVFGECDSSAYRVGERLQSTILKVGSAETRTRLIYGPWAHGGRRGCLSGGGGSWPCAERQVYADFIKFIRSVSRGARDGSMEVLRWKSRGESGEWLVGYNVTRELSVEDESHVAFYGMGPSGTYMAPMRPRSHRFVTKGTELGWIDPETVWTRAKEKFNLSKMFRGEYVTKPNLPVCARRPALLHHWCTVKTIFRLPDPLRYDFRRHWELRDWFGLAYDFSDSISYFADAARKVVQRMRRAPAKRSTHRKSMMAGNGTRLEYIEGELPEWTTGRYSRWVIVQHLLRLPVEYSTTNPYAPTSLPSLVVESLPLSQKFVINGSPAVSLRMLLTQEDLRDDFCVVLRASLEPDVCTTATTDRESDMIISAVLHERSGADGTLQYLTEGRLLLSMKGEHDVDWSVDSAETLAKLASSSTPVARSYNRTFNSVVHRFPSQLLKSEAPFDHGGGGGLVVVDARLTMESITREIPRHSRLVLTLFGSDVDNFRWDAVVERYKRHSKDHNNRAFEDVRVIESVKLLTSVGDRSSVPVILSLPKLAAEEASLRSEAASHNW